MRERRASMASYSYWTAQRNRGGHAIERGKEDAQMSDDDDCDGSREGWVPERQCGDFGNRDGGGGPDEIITMESHFVRSNDGRQREETTSQNIRKHQWPRIGEGVAGN